MRRSLATIVSSTIFLSGCFTIQSKSTVNFQEIGDVSGTAASKGDAKELSGVSIIKTGFLFMPCSKLCTKAVENLLDDAKDNGGNALVDVTFEGKGNQKSKTPMCLTRWSLIDLLVVPIFSPWKKKCRVEAMAVKRPASDSIQPSASAGRKESPDAKSVREKAKKCQEKGGIWVNDSCQIDVD